MPIPGNPGTRLPTLGACLKAVRVRTRIKSMVRGAVFSLVATLALLCGLEISGLYFEMATPAGSLALLSEHPLSCLAFGAAALACAFALATFLAFFRTPDAAVLARKADRALALQERLSTALEVDKSLPPDAVLGPVPSALLADAERHAAMIDPRQIVRLDLPRAIWAVPGLIAAALLIQLVPPDALAVARGSIAGAERDQAGFTGQQSAEAAANLRRIAELLGKDAQERSEPPSESGGAARGRRSRRRRQRRDGGARPDGSAGSTVGAQDGQRRNAAADGGAGPAADFGRSSQGP